MAGIDPVHLRVARSFGLSRTRTLRAVVLPSLVRPLATGLRLGLGVAVIGCLLGEIKLSNRGLGFLAISTTASSASPRCMLSCWRCLH